MNRAVDRPFRGGASGWFWFADTGGLPVSAPRWRGGDPGEYAFSAGLSTVLGPLVFTVPFPFPGITGVRLAFAVLYAVSAVLARTLKDGADPGEPGRGSGGTGGSLAQ